MKTCIYLIFSLYAICIQAQDIYNNLNQKFTQYLIKTLPENIYVQTDKPYYVVEDTIWMKAFVVNAQLLQPSPSNFVYVELINQQNEVLNRIKLKKDSDYPFMHLLYSQLLVCQRVCLQNTVCLICK